MYTPVWSNSPTSTLSCKAIDRNGLTNPSDQDENVFRSPIPCQSMYIRYNHQEWEHKLFLAGNWPWRAGFFITDPVLKPYGKLLTLWSSFLQNTVRKGVLQLPIHYVCPLSAGWKIISTNQNYWPDQIARVQNCPDITVLTFPSVMVMVLECLEVPRMALFLQNQKYHSQKWTLASSADSFQLFIPIWFDWPDSRIKSRLQWIW